MGPEDDPADAGPEVGAETEDVVAAEDVAAPVTARSRRPSARLAAALAAVVLAALGAVSIGWAATHQQGPPPAPAVSGPAAPTLAAGPPLPATVSPPAPTGAQPSSPPVTLRIAAIGVSSPVDQVGLNPDRTMEVPAKGTPGYDHAAWFRYSVAPGRQGPSVIIGHVDSREGGPSVFYDLGGLRPGDRAEVALADGATVAFEVTDVRRVPKTAFPTALVYGPTPGPELRLITCGGSFDDDARSYADNTVVFARESPVRPVVLETPGAPGRAQRTGRARKCMAR